MPFISLAAAALIGAAVTAVAGLAGSALNYQSQIHMNQLNKQAVDKTNATNLEIAQENNALQMDLAKNGVSYKMQDLKNAGLNPILAAGGMSQPQATLSTPHMQAAQGVAPQVDFSGIASAVNAMNNTMLTEYITKSKEGISDDRNKVLENLYQRKAEYFREPTKTANALGHSAKQIRVDTNKLTAEEKAFWKDFTRHAPK